MWNITSKIIFDLSCMITRKTLKSGLYFYGIDPAGNPGGYFQIRRSGGGVGPHIKFEGKIWGKVWPSSQNKRKNLGSSVTKRRKSWEKVLFLGSYLKFRGQNLGYLSFIFLEVKFGAPTRISEAKFGAKPPNLLIWNPPPPPRG